MLSESVYLLVFKINEEEFAVEIKYVQEIIKRLHITRVPCTFPYMLGVVNVRGLIIPVMDIAKKLNIHSSGYGEESRIIVIQLKEQFLGLIVSSTSEALRLSPKDIEIVSSFSDRIATDYLTGIGKTGRRLISVLDVEKLFLTPSGNENKVGGLFNASI